MRAKHKKTLKKHHKVTKQEYYCRICDYSCNKLYNLNRHLMTDKHKSSLILEGSYNEKEQGQEVVVNEGVLYGCVCGKKYKYRQGLYRHRKICKYKDDEIVEHNNSNTINDVQLTNKLVELMENNEKLQEQIIRLQNEHINNMNSLIPKIGNNVNNFFNINMFLDNECSNAMTIQKFAKQLEVNLEDLEKNRRECLTNIIIKNLKPLSITERPVHYHKTNSKKWYINDEKNGWSEDNGEKLIRNIEYGIQRNWINAFNKEYPNWLNNENLKDKYIKFANIATTDTNESTKMKLLKFLSSSNYIMLDN